MVEVGRFEEFLRISRSLRFAFYLLHKVQKINQFFFLFCTCRKKRSLVGYLGNKRLNQHFSGNGAQVTKKNRPVSVNHIQKCKNVRNAKKAETIVYYNMKNYHGANRVRGAGNTRPFNKKSNYKRRSNYSSKRRNYYSYYKIEK